MKELELKSWEEFENHLQKLFSIVESRRQRTTLSVSKPLFRGQDDSNDGLKSTLDRIKPNYTLHKYHIIMQKISNFINSSIESNWEITNYVPPKTDFWIDPQAYEFMIYLRHHGFPSPLLDWTYSPYIATFFAFNSHSNSPKVAIFSFIQLFGHIRTVFDEDDSPVISEPGPNVKTHKRHYIQQSNYTLNTKKKNSEYYFAKYEEVDEVIVKESLKQQFYEQQNFKKNEDIFIKYTLPASEKRKVITKLDLMNINEYSLFGTEEALMGTLRNREFPP